MSLPTRRNTNPSVSFHQSPWRARMKKKRKKKGNTQLLQKPYLITSRGEKNKCLAADSSSQTSQAVGLG